MNSVTASSARAADQSTRVSQYSFEKPEIPTDHVDPTVAAPPPPSGSVKEHFASTNSVGVVIILGLLAVAILYRRR
jgi:hypothetical protein